MKFTRPLLKGTLIKRYKRFLADIILEKGEIITAHCANTGSMLGLNNVGSEVWISLAQNPNRKLKYTWEMIRVGKGLVGVNTARSNEIVQHAIQRNKISELVGYPSLRREIKYGKSSRIDILLEGANRPNCFVEVKSVTLMRGAWAEFPDAITKRGTKHLVELTNQVKAGNRAVMFYLVQRADCVGFTVAGDIDAAYAEALADAISAGVEVYCYKCNLTPKQISLDMPLFIRD